MLDYTAISKALHTLDAATEAMISKKFEITHFIAKENRSFLKMGPLCELLERQGIDIGQNCKNDKACFMFVLCMCLENTMCYVGISDWKGRILVQSLCRSLSSICGYLVSSAQY